MHGFRHYGWLYSRLIIFSVGLGLVCQQMALTQEPVSNTERANQLVDDALDAELHGLRSQRDRLLSEAIEVDPASRRARWHLGQVLIEEEGEKSEWATIETVEVSTDEKPDFAEYASIRETKPDDLRGNEAVAEWCTRKGFDQRAAAHWARVLQLQPGHRKAIGRLGLRNFQGQWLTREQISTIKDRQREVVALQKEWRPVVAGWSKRYRRQDGYEKERIRKEIKEAARPELVGMFETQLTPVDEELGMAVVDAIDSVPDQVATESLLRHAVLSKWGSVRSEAVRRLKSRPPHGYVPILIDAMMAPLEFQSWNVQSASMDGQVLAMNYTIGQQGKHVDRMVRGSVDFIGAGDSDSADEAREEIQDRVEDVNQARERFNRPLAQVLRLTTGQGFDADPTQWNDWWNEFNEYLVPDFRPVLTSFRRPSRVIVATRPFACFPAGTFVSTETGKKPIEEIRVGDFVLSKNAVTGELRYQPVLQTTVRDSDAILEVIINDELLRVTRGHPMWVNGRQWQMAKQLRPGSQLHGAQGPAEVRWVRDARMQTKVYNLVVDEFHTYFVGDARVLVHDNTLYTPPGVTVPGR